MLLAWTIGFIVFFVRRKRQRELAKAGGFKSHRDIIDFAPVPKATTFIIPPDPALVGPRKSYENQVHDLERQGELEKSPTSHTRLRASQDQREGETVPSPEESSRTNSTTNSTPMITTMSPSTVDLSTVESSYPMLDSSARLPLAPLTRKTPGGRKK